MKGEPMQSLRKSLGSLLSRFRRRRVDQTIPAAVAEMLMSSRDRQRVARAKVRSMFRGSLRPVVVRIGERERTGRRRKLLRIMPTTGGLIGNSHQRRLQARWMSRMRISSLPHSFNWRKDLLKLTAV